MMVDELSFYILFLFFWPFMQVFYILCLTLLYPIRFNTLSHIRSLLVGEMKEIATSLAALLGELSKTVCSDAARNYMH